MSLLLEVILNEIQQSLRLDIFVQAGSLINGEKMGQLLCQLVDRPSM